MVGIVIRSRAGAICGGQDILCKFNAHHKGRHGLLHKSRRMKRHRIAGRTRKHSPTEEGWQRYHLNSVEQSTNKGLQSTSNSVLSRRDRKWTEQCVTSMEGTFLDKIRHPTKTRAANGLIVQLVYAWRRLRGLFHHYRSSSDGQDRSYCLIERDVLEGSEFGRNKVINWVISGVWEVVDSSKTTVMLRNKAQGGRDKAGFRCRLKNSESSML